MDKAKALFEYVQLNIKYDYYFDTDKGAVKTLSEKEGNGADHAHLLIAMFRTAGLKARYYMDTVHCTLIKKLSVMYGLRYSLTAHGFVWTQQICPTNLEAYPFGM